MRLLNSVVDCVYMICVRHVKRDGFNLISNIFTFESSIVLLTEV